jgi:hypothetical protein
MSGVFPGPKLRDCFANVTPAIAVRLPAGRNRTASRKQDAPADLLGASFSRLSASGPGSCRLNGNYFLDADLERIRHFLQAFQGHTLV